MATLTAARKTISTLLKNVDQKSLVIEEYTHQTKLFEVWQLNTTRSQTIIVTYEFIIPNQVDRIQVYFESNHDNLQSIIAELIHKGEYVPDDPIKVQHVTRTYREPYRVFTFLHDVFVVSLFTFMVLGIMALFFSGLYFLYYLVRLI